jgi:chlorobactene glucosyltransferase
MPVIFVIWAVACGLVGLLWLTRHVEISRARRAERVLSASSYDGPPESQPRVSILIAAKDEEHSIRACVESFLGQDYPNYQLIVVNDRSTDRTGAILGDLAAQANGKLQVLTVETVREGWFGKSNAMREGVALADGEWLCFADADCRQTSARTLSVAVCEATENGLDFLSVLPVLETHGFWERLLQPVCAAILMIWFHPQRVNDPRSRTAYANGAFMLMKRSCYERIGGHDRVKTQVNEDMHLARLAKQAGLRLAVIRNQGLYVTRMYSSFAETWRGWSRIFYGCFGSFRRLALTAVLILVASIFPWVSLFVAAAAALMRESPGPGPWRMVALVAAVVAILQQTVTFRFYRLTGSYPAWSVGYILGVTLCLGMLVNAMLKLGGTTRTVWRGTVYRGDQLERPVTSSAIGPSQRASRPRAPAG